MSPLDTSTTTKANAPSLMTLPTELRLEILSHTGLISPPHIVIENSFLLRNPPWPTALFFACRQLSLEAREMFISRNRFYFRGGNPAKMLRHLKLLDKQSLKWIRHLRFDVDLKHVVDLISVHKEFPGGYIDRADHGRYMESLRKTDPPSLRGLSTKGIDLIFNPRGRSYFSVKDWKELVTFIAQNLLLPSLTMHIHVYGVSYKKDDRAPLVSKLKGIIEPVVQIRGLKRHVFILPVLRSVDASMGAEVATEVMKEALGVMWYRYQGKRLKDL